MMRLFAIVFVLLGLPVAALGDAPPAPHLELDIALDPAMRQLTATADLSVDSDMLQFALRAGFAHDPPARRWQTARPACSR